MKTDPHTLQQNETKRQARSFANNITVCTGTRIQEIEAGYTTVGFTDLMVWNPQQQRHIPLSPLDNDKFLITTDHDDISTAWSEFYARWRLYCVRRFKLSYVKIETNN